MDASTSQQAVDSDYLRGWRDGFGDGYDMAARGQMSANMVLVVLPNEDRTLHDRIRERIHEVLRDEGVPEAPVVDLVG